MPYENNHFVPRLVLRRYGNKINYYNLKTNKLYMNKNIDNCFAQKNLYPLELELELGKLESKFADLLNNRILNANDKIILSREELVLIKKFLLIEMFRVPDALVERAEIRKNPGFNSKLYGFNEKIIEGETYSEYVFRTIRTIINSNDIDEYIKNEDKTFEGAKWFNLVNSCYLTFWDSTKSNEDFLITDRGLTCEHEKTRFAFERYGFHEELIKEGFVLSKMLDSNLGHEQFSNYNQILRLSSYVFANYYMFSISETRMIGLINPWYRMWFDEQLINVLGGTPDVYPCMLSKEAMKANYCKYVNQRNEDGFVTYDKNDEYIYDIKYLGFDDVCIINVMMLDRTYELLGFVNSKRIIRSLAVYNHLKVKLNDLSGLQKELETYGYDFPKSVEYLKKADKITRISFTEEEQKYINYIFGLKNKMKDDII